MYNGELLQRSDDFRAGFDKATLSSIDYIADALEELKSPLYTKKQVQAMLQELQRHIITYRDIGYMDDDGNIDRDNKLFY